MPLMLLLGMFSLTFRDGRWGEEKKGMENGVGREIWAEGWGEGDACMHAFFLGAFKGGAEM